MPLYEPLPTNRAWIRLLTLHSDEGTDDTSTLNCTLQAKLLDDVEYEAISYVWGDPKQTRQIRCNGYVIDVTVSLYGALEKLQFCMGSETPTLWADAICIDQSNIAERNSQVSMMGSIYQRARSVQIWLGEDIQDQAQSAFDLCNEVVEYYADGYHSDEETVWYDWPEPPSPDEPFLQPSRWGHLRTLSQLPWFSRVWVLQEAGVAQTADVHWGQASIKFSHMIEAFILVNLHSCFLPMVAKYGFEFTFINDTWSEIWSTYDLPHSWRSECPYIRFASIHPKILQRRNIFSVLSAGTRFHASDPHDYIYGHLGHPAARGEDGKVFVDVDYGKGLAELYLEVAEKLIVEEYGLLLLSAAEHIEGAPDEGPSWVPKWHRASGSGMIAPGPTNTERWYDASLTDSIKAEVGIKTDRGTGNALLQTCGILFDTVTGCSTILERIETTSSDQPLEAAFSLVRQPLNTEIVDTLSLVMIAGRDGHTEKAAQDDLQKHRANFQAYYSGDESLDPTTKTELNRIIDVPASLGGNGDEYKRNLDDYCHRRRLFRTANGRFGLGPSAMQQGDVCCIIFGALVPFVIRRSDRWFKLVGECYIHGVMRGEIVNEMLQQQLSFQAIVLE
ncbi:MAG: hypothetical protein LQ346_005273 [Caloplaca aetnensis]|nr:MAG: hypothetical protein LQ346_005273 [Caloplaca aetnensis]